MVSERLMGVLKGNHEKTVAEGRNKKHKTRVSTPCPCRARSRRPVPIALSEEGFR